MKEAINVCHNKEKVVCCSSSSKVATKKSNNPIRELNQQYQSCIHPSLVSSLFFFLLGCPKTAWSVVHVASFLQQPINIALHTKQHLSSFFPQDACCPLLSIRNAWALLALVTGKYYPISLSFSFLFIDINHAYRGSAVGKIIGQNVLKHKDIFETEVRQWVFEETFKGEKLTTLINRDHENPK